MSTLDIVIAIPVAPLLPVLVTWYLPWERWLPSRIPKIVLGPYLVYASFAAWHFRMPWWLVLVVAAWGLIVTLMAVTEKHSADKK